MQPVEVTARFAPDGKITPLRFRWRGGQYPIASTGRSWQAEDGQHILVMTTDGQMFELLFTPQAACWYLLQVGPQRMPV